MPHRGTVVSKGFRSVVLSTFPLLAQHPEPDRRRRALLPRPPLLLDVPRVVHEATEAGDLERRNPEGDRPPHERPLEGVQRRGRASSRSSCGSTTASPCILHARTERSPSHRGSWTPSTPGAPSLDTRPDWRVRPHCQLPSPPFDPRGLSYPEWGNLHCRGSSSQVWSPRATR